MGTVSREAVLYRAKKSAPVQRPADAVNVSYQNPNVKKHESFPSCFPHEASKTLAYAEYVANRIFKI